MRFGVFHQVTWPSGSAVEGAFEQALEACQRAEELGYGTFWLAAHHLAPAALRPDPFRFAAALVERTARIAVGVALDLGPDPGEARASDDRALSGARSDGRVRAAAWFSPETTHLHDRIREQRLGLLCSASTLLAEARTLAAWSGPLGVERAAPGGVALLRAAVLADSDAQAFALANLGFGQPGFAEELPRDADGPLIGSPDALVRRLQAFPDRIELVLNFKFGSLPDAPARESAGRFARDVLPRFAPGPSGKLASA